ncbi:MAG: hypothetical protein Q4G43_17755, partial [Mobilicoccus sp.]|nr:hypothetical protein [Mobilicoccus sp.]
RTHRHQVEDDVGNRVALLLQAQNDEEVGKLVGEYVTVTGRPELDFKGSLTKISDAAVTQAPDLFGDEPAKVNVSLAQILASAPGPQPGGIPGLTDAELDAFLEAMS